MENGYGVRCGSLIIVGLDVCYMWVKVGVINVINKLVGLVFGGLVVYVRLSRFE